MDFTIFYIEVEDLVTSEQLRYTEVLNLYDQIISTIDTTVLPNARETKLWMTDIYKEGQDKYALYNESYYLRVIPFVKLLQSLVVGRRYTDEYTGINTYSSVDDFYEIEGVIVSQTFAELSEVAGYPISPQYIKDIS